MKKTSVYLLDISTKKFRKLNIHGIFSSNIAFSPDGNKIVFAKTPREWEFYKWKVWENYILEIYDLEKEETIMRLSEFDRSVTPIKWTSKESLQPGRIEQTIELEWFLKRGKSLQSIARMNVFIVDADSTSDGENIAYIKIEKNNAAEVYINSVQVTNESRVYENKLLSKKEIITWITKDGLEIEGVYPNLMIMILIKSIRFW